MANQHQTPLIDAIRNSQNTPRAAFYTPGHKGGVGISPVLSNLLGKQLFQADLTELTELDNLFTPQGAILAAQELASETFGADKTWFLINGSTCGIAAAILATCNPGEKIILPRNIHSSAVTGLILSGAIPVFINPEYDSVLDIAHCVSPLSVATALEQHPDAKAVLVVYPTYYGVCGDLNAIAHITHNHNLPLLVDEAHGAHFAFHPQLPTAALAAGADLTVQSIHKVLGAMTQASMLHIKGNRINPKKISSALQLVQSTSPSYILLASLDAARHQMAIHGRELMSKALNLATIATNEINQIPGLTVLDMPNSDTTRLTVKVTELGMSGFAAEEILDTKLGVTPEFATWQHLTFIITFGNRLSDIQQLVKAFMSLSQSPPSTPFSQPKSSIWQHITNNLPSLSPREAYFAPWETVPIDKAIHRISTEIICPYPPGIPVLMPGEVITKDVLEDLQAIQSMGGLITGCTDASLNTFQVV